MMIKLLLVTLLPIIAVTSCGGDTNLPIQNIEYVKTHPSSKATPEYVQGQLIVQFIDGLSEEQHLAIFRKHALRLIKTIELTKRLYLVQIEDAKTIEEKLPELQKILEIAIVEPNYISHLDDK